MLFRSRGTAISPRLHIRPHGMAEPTLDEELMADTSKRQLHTRNVVAMVWNRTGILPRHAYRVLEPANYFNFYLF